MSSKFNFVRSPKFPYLCVFLVGVVLRGIPELLVSRYPVGYETITYYAPAMMTFYGRSLIDVFTSTFGVGPLFYALMWLVANVSGAHAFLILKVTGPLLYGGLAFSFFVFLKRGLKLDGKMAFVATLLLVFQVAALRISWDRFRNVLALVFLFTTFTALKSERRYRWPLVAVFAALTALSREYIAFVLFIAALSFSFLENRDKVMSLVALSPAITIFTAIFYQTWLWWSFAPDGQYVWRSYLGLVQDVVSIFAVCYLPLLPFVVKGFRRDKLLDPMLGWLLLGSFSVIVSPWLAVPGYQRWLMLLVFPFGVYAATGLERFHLLDKGRRKMLATVLTAFMIIGVGYSTGSFSYIRPNRWLPVNLVQSSIGWGQIDDVMECLKWLNNKAASNSSILTEERFYGWTLLYLERANKDIKVIVYSANSSPEPALEEALDGGFSQIYLIWYTDLSSKVFKRIYTQNTVSIFRYEL